jgi:uncharacterized membrane protein YhfC
MIAIAGRLMQMIGLLLLPIGLSIGLFRNDVNLEVRLLFIGGGVFFVGWLLARKR